MTATTAPETSKADIVLKKLRLARGVTVAQIIGSNELAVAFGAGLLLCGGEEEVRP